MKYKHLTAALPKTKSVQDLKGMLANKSKPLTIEEMNLAIAKCAAESGMPSRLRKSIRKRRATTT
jgi:hypothetical protein